jgi:hypothetical protein
MQYFDETGRCIPANLGVKSEIVNENSRFRVELPTLKSEELYERITAVFRTKHNFATISQIEDETGELFEKWSEDELIGNFFKRAQKISFPKIYERDDYGELLKRIVFPAVITAYGEFSPQNVFDNWIVFLSKNFRFVPGTGYSELLDLMTERPVTGWYSPNPLQGFSILAQRESMKILKKFRFALMGAITTGTALATYMQSMITFHSPIYNCSSASYVPDGISRDFMTYSRYKLCFGTWSKFSPVRACDHASGGLFLYQR